MTIYGKCEKL